MLVTRPRRKAYDAADWCCELLIGFDLLPVSLLTKIRDEVNGAIDRLRFFRILEIT